jgi:hypothetical protein
VERKRAVETRVAARVEAFRQQQADAVGMSDYNERVRCSVREKLVCKIQIRQLLSC